MKCDKCSRQVYMPACSDYFCSAGRWYGPGKILFNSGDCMSNESDPWESCTDFSEVPATGIDRGEGPG